MTETPTSPVSEDELHAFIDGRLPPQREAAVRRHLADHPDLAREVESWRETETALRAALEAFHHGQARDIPSAPSRAPARPGGWPAVAAALALAFGLGGGAGYFLRGTVEPARVEAADAGWLDRAARDVFLTYVREVRHPVEVGANEYEHLVTWLGNRIETPFTAPGLDELGFSLVGGRLLPIGGLPGAMLMYENAQGDRAVILLARNRNARDTAFQFSASDGVNTFRWVDGPLAYAISGFLDRPALEDISRAVYAHFETI